ncbi:MAG: YggT family protein [Epulopiscium sp.]|jgi:YggT family protein|nr:YggT family protein [Candidatus Epulonipiscium sp.]
MNFGVLLYLGVIYFFKIINYLIVIRVILSWLPIDRQNPLVAFVYQLTEPILAPARKLLAKSSIGGSGLMIDFSPLIAMAIMYFVERCLLYYIAKFFI